MEVTKPDIDSALVGGASLKGHYPPGKSGAGDLFSSNVSSTAFGARGTASVLPKITIGAAAATSRSGFRLAFLRFSLVAAYKPI